MSTAHQEESRWYPHGMASMTPEMSMQHVLQRRLGAEVEVIPQQTTLYVKPQGVRYEMDGKQRRWEMVVSHPSVAVLLYHTQLKTFILVRQFRPAVYVSAAAEAALAGNPRPPLSVGFTYELCAGIIDKPHLDLKGIAREEILEECGYDVPTHKLHEVTSYISAIGISGARQTIFAAEVDDSMRAPGGGGLADHGEAIEVLSLPASGVAAFLMDQTLAKSGGILFSLMWAQQQLVENDGGLFQRCA